EVGHVVTAEHRPPVVEQAVTQPVAGLDERRPRLGPADAVDGQAAGLLERGDRRRGGLVVDAAHGAPVAGVREALVEVPDLGAGRADPEGERRRAGGTGHMYGLRASRI